MKELFKGKFATGLVILATVILAGVAIFTATRLYQLRQESVSPLAPESNPLAWDCSRYTFSVSTTGLVRVENNSSRNEPAQQAEVFINSNSVANLAVPSLTSGQSANLGNVQVPGGGFSWRVVGSRDCSNSGTMATACTTLTFKISQNTPTPTKKLTLTPTTGITGTATPTIALTLSPTNPPQSTVSPTPIPPPQMPSPPNCVATRPDAPILTSVERSGTTATLKWTKVNLATHYVISYGTSPDNFQYGVPNTGNVTTYTIEKLSANTKYYFTVYAVNDCMPSEGSAVVTSVAGASTGTAGELPATGMSIPTIVGIGLGILLIAAALFLAF